MLISSIFSDPDSRYAYNDQNPCRVSLKMRLKSLWDNGHSHVTSALHGQKAFEKLCDEPK